MGAEEHGNLIANTIFVCGFSIAPLDRAKRRRIPLIAMLALSIETRIDTKEWKAMATAKDELTKLIQAQPDDSTYDEILRELAFNLMIQRGLMDSDEGRTISNEEMERRIRIWQK